MKIHRHLAHLALAGCAFAFAGSVSAQVKAWNFGDTQSPGSCTGSYSTSANSNFGNIINCTQQPNGTVVDLYARAYSSTGNSGTTFQTAGINQQGVGSGFGVWNRSEDRNSGQPHHAMDNSTPGIDMLMLQFTTAEILKSVTIGWSGTDGDFQVLRWIGSSSATASTVNSSINGKTASSMLAAGGNWELVTLVDGAGGINTPDIAYGVNANNLSSSFWLISAYNSAFGGSGFTSGIDAIKVLGVTAGLPSGGGGGGSVSAPGTLALASLGVIGTGLLRRRRNS